MGTPINRAGSKGFGVTERDRTGGSLAMDKGGDQAKVVLGSVEGAEHDMD